jgi:hypothetical protein
MVSSDLIKDMPTAVVLIGCKVVVAMKCSSTWVQSMLSKKEIQMM